jgi:hypothetical protein
MTNIQVEWTGLQHLIDDIRGLPKEVAKEVQKAQEEDLRDVASLLANYPPVHFGQHYIRTGRLGFGWLEAKAKSRLLGDLGFEVSLSNNTPYAGAVQGSQGNENPKQEPFFRERGWESVDDALKATEGRFKKRIDEAVQRALDKQLKNKYK